MIRFFALILFCQWSNFTVSQSELADFRHKIDSLVYNAIDSAAFPGAQVIISYKNEVIVHKAYGYHTFRNIAPVDTNDLYDLASVTKVMAGGLSLMKLQDKGLFDPAETLAQSHPFFKGSDKEELHWREILAHQSGMKPYIVFWQTAKKKNGQYKWRTFSFKRNKWNSIQIDNEIFLHRRYPKVMKKLIKRSEVGEKKYLYSGLGFLLIPELVERRSGRSLDQFLEEEVYAPIQADRITFDPLKKFDLDDIVPTETDTFFRNKLVHGYVHDENASMLNGVSANAGLFANASSLNKVANMLLNPDNGVLSNAIIGEYTSVQFPDNNNRRGLTFDKPSLDGSTTYIAPSASASSFGHSGFTGTFIWIDPDHELTIIFLSNRVHPFRSNRKLYSMNFRPQLHQAAYDFIN